MTNKKTLRAATLRVFVLPMGIYRIPLLCLLYARTEKKSTKKKKDIIFDVIQRKNGEENRLRSRIFSWEKDTIEANKITLINNGTDAGN